MKAYLSIDCDYWRRHQDPRSCTAFFQEVWKLGLPIYVAMFHHHLLPHINSFNCDTLINVDFHSDLVDLDIGRATPFNEGTWGNFIDWRYDGTFVWRYPSSECLEIGRGYCHYKCNPFQEPWVAGWQFTKKRPGLWGVPWQHVKAVGVCLSPDWLGNTDAIAEPLTKLHVNHWLTTHYFATNNGHEPKRRMPKTVRVKPKEK